MTISKWGHNYQHCVHLFSEAGTKTSGEAPELFQIWMWQWTWTLRWQKTCSQHWMFPVSKMTHPAHMAWGPLGMSQHPAQIPPRTRPASEGLGAPSQGAEMQLDGRGVVLGNQNMSLQSPLSSRQSHSRSAQRPSFPPPNNMQSKMT